MKRLATFTAILCMSILNLAACGNSNSKKSADTDNATVIELSSEDFNSKVFNINAEDLKYLGDKPALIDFNATWCGPCKRIAPILEELAAEYGGQIVIYKVDVDNCGDIARAFDIQSIPAILYVPTEGEPQMTIGSRTKSQFMEEINKILLNK